MCPLCQLRQWIAARRAAAAHKAFLKRMSFTHHLPTRVVQENKKTLKK